jgi:hypothetical protein
VWAVWAVWGSRPLLTFDIPQTALVATLDTYDFIIDYWGGEPILAVLQYKTNS